MRREHLCEKYEELRAFSMGQPTPTMPLGLGVLLREGLLSWSKALPSIPQDPVPDQPPENAPALPSLQPLVEAMATMVWQVTDEKERGP
jgi:hypothetical protein